MAEFQGSTSTPLSRLGPTMNNVTEQIAINECRTPCVLPASSPRVYMSTVIKRGGAKFLSRYISCATQSR